MSNFTKGFILALYLIIDVMTTVFLYSIIVIIIGAVSPPQKLISYFFFLLFLAFVSFLISRQIYFFKYFLIHVKFVSIDNQEICFLKGKKKYTHSIENITKVKIRGQTTTVYCNSPHKKYILDSKMDSPFFTENVDTDELRAKLIYAKFI